MIASGGARFFPGRPISATISDRTTLEPGETQAAPNTEAVEGLIKRCQDKIDQKKAKRGRANLAYTECVR